MAHSTDLREKALDYYEQCKNISQVAKVFDIARSTLYQWIDLKKQTGGLDHQVKGQNAAKLDTQQIIQYIEQHPDAYLHEIAEHLDCSSSAVFYACERLGITRKKRQPCTKNKTLKK